MAQDTTFRNELILGPPGGTHSRSPGSAPASGRTNPQLTMFIEESSCEESAPG
jgi:hypothetical protein